MRKSLYTFALWSLAIVLVFTLLIVTRGAQWKS